jgi:uncharacterized protein YfaQ (DUF2300 family)
VAWIFVGCSADPAGAQPYVRPAAIAANTLKVAWLDDDGQLQTALVGANGHVQYGFDLPKNITLGSLWKLVAYAHWIETKAPAPVYRCEGKLKDEVYCCAPGESIDRAKALVKSCGLYFSAVRTPWNLPLGNTLQNTPPPIAKAIRNHTLGADTKVDVGDWLRWLASWPLDMRQQAQSDLLPYWLQGPGKTVLGEVGSQLRLKTYTLENIDNSRWAGASGWLAQTQRSNLPPTPLWFGTAGSSAHVVPEKASQIIKIIHEKTISGTEAIALSPNADAPSHQTTCVRVRYFARYPIRTIHAITAPTTTPISTPLRGRYLVTFENGSIIEINSTGELQLRRQSQKIELYGELDLDQYVARVIDREANAEPAHAARALAVAARSYVLAHGRMQLGCLEIDDSSHAQRVAPRPATRGALHAALVTNELIVKGAYAVPGQYHSTRAREGTMAWATAVTQSRDGMNFNDILGYAYPKASLASLYSDSAVACQALPLAQRWLETQIPAWRRQLVNQPGFKEPPSVQVCRLHSGRAHAHDGSRRIDVSGHQSLEERIAIAHEYLHLAFTRHPRSRDESFIEALARQLVGV